VSAKKAFD
jgi:hypothetical protein